MKSGDKKVVSYLVVLLLCVNLFNTFYPMVTRSSVLSGKASSAQVSFGVTEVAKQVNISLFWLPAVDATVISGLPLGVNVSVTYVNATPVSNATVRMIETNGWNSFAPTQYWPTNPPFDAGVKNYQIAQVYTDANGGVNFSVVTTGGDSGNEDLIANYSVVLEVWFGDQLLERQTINNTNRGLPSENGTIYDVPNENWVNEMRDKLLVIYNRVKDWDGGDTSNIIVYSNNTDNGTVLNTTSGKPLGLQFTVLNASTLSPIQGAGVNITEHNGWSAFAVTQYWPTNPPFDAGVSNMLVGEAYTDSAGQVNLTIIPTGGDSGNENLIGSYRITLNVTAGTEVVYSQPLILGNRGLPAAGTGNTVPNQNWVEETRDKLLVVYNRVKGWL